MRRTDRASRPGLTLIELLVVIFILLTITAIAIPIMAPNLEERRVREASRMVTSFLQSARTRAIQSGRPFGVVLEPLPGTTSACIQLSYAEVMPPYAGDSTDSRVHVFVAPGSNFGRIDAFINSAGAPAADSGWIGLLRPNDVIKLNYQGHYYRLWSGDPFTDNNSNGVYDAGDTFTDVCVAPGYTAPNTTTGGSDGYLLGPLVYASSITHWVLIPITTTSVPSSGFVFDADGDSVYDVGDVMQGWPFQVYRQPSRTAAPPMQLPDGIAIDFDGSGVDQDVFGGTPPYGIFFTAGGAVGTLYSASGQLTAVGPIHLLVGKRENVPMTVANQENLRDLQSFWVNIHAQTGLVTATEMAPVVEPLPAGGGTFDQALVEARRYAQEGKSTGGR